MPQNRQIPYSQFMGHSAVDPHHSTSPTQGSNANSPVDAVPQSVTNRENPAYILDPSCLGFAEHRRRHHPFENTVINSDQ